MSKELNLKIPVSVENKYLLIINQLGGISPFSLLRAKEKELLSWLYYYNNLYLQIPEDDRMILISSKKTIISETMGISLDNYYNLFMALKKRNFIIKDKLNPRYVIGDIDKIVFTFISK